MTDVVVSPRYGQRMAALREANRVREARAAVKRDLKAGRVSLVDALDHPDCGSALVVDLLLALPRVGRTKANRAMARARVSTVKTAGGMTGCQRAALLAELARWPLMRPVTAPENLGPSRVERPRPDVGTSRLGPEQTTATGANGPSMRDRQGTSSAAPPCGEERDA